jgi:hypothetical protein
LKNRKKSVFLVLLLIISTVIIYFPEKCFVEASIATITEEINYSASSTLYDLKPNYEDARTALTATNIGTNLAVGQTNFTGVRYMINRGFLNFDTTIIPEYANITNATLSLFLYTNSTTKNFNCTILSGGSLHPSNPLSLTDYYMGYYSGNGGYLDTSTFTSNNTYYNITLNSAGLSYIQKAGITKLAIFSSNDINDIAPTQYESCVFLSNTTYPIKLSITYEIPPSVTYQNLSVSGTKANTSVTFSSTWNSRQPYKLSSYIFSTNNTGIWQNSTTTAFTEGSTIETVNIVQTLNSTLNQIIGYKWYANDTENTWNSTEIQTLTTTGYTITPSFDSYSNVTPNTTQTVCAGATINFTYTPEPGYNIESVIVNGSYSIDPASGYYTFSNVQSNQAISVSTSTIIYYIDASSDSGSALTYFDTPITGLIAVPYGNYANFTCTALGGYQLFNLLINGVGVGAVSSYSFLPTQNTTVQLLSIASSLPSGGGGGGNIIIIHGNDTSTVIGDTPQTQELDPLVDVGIALIIAVLIIAVGLGYYQSNHKKSIEQLFKDKNR